MIPWCRPNTRFCNNNSRFHKEINFKWSQVLTTHKRTLQLHHFILWSRIWWEEQVKICKQLCRQEEAIIVEWRVIAFRFISNNNFKILIIPPKLRSILKTRCIQAAAALYANYLVYHLTESAQAVARQLTCIKTSNKKIRASTSLTKLLQSAQKSSTCHSALT